MENVKSKDRPVDRLIRICEVKRLTGISTATLYRKISAKEFPPPVRLGVAARAWPLSEVLNWIAGRIELRGALMTDTTNKTATVSNSFSAPQMEDAMNKIKLQVDLLFRDAPPVHGQRCQNPVTGGFYIGFEDPIAPQKRMACRALLARVWFALCGPQDAQPLPISDVEIEDRKYAWGNQSSLSYIVSCFGYSLRAHNWDFSNHPSFEDFVRGVLAAGYAPDFVKEDEALRKRYPPCPLCGLNPGNCWEPPKLHTKRYRATASLGIVESKLRSP